jgi:hypothetical protein
VLTVNHLRTIGASQADAAGLLGSGCALRQLTAGASIVGKKRRARGWARRCSSVLRAVTLLRTHVLLDWIRAQSSQPLGPQRPSLANRALSAFAAGRLDTR